MIKNREKLQFSIFWESFCNNGSKNDEHMIKKDKNMKKTRKIAIFHFFENFGTTGSKNDET